MAVEKDLQEKLGEHSVDDIANAIRNEFTQAGVKEIIGLLGQEWSDT